jgi:HK97 family phage prohead protease
VYRVRKEDDMTATIPARYDTVQERAADIEAVDPDRGTVLLRAAPYGVEAQLDLDLWEQFDRATFAAATKAPHRTKLWNLHGGPLVGHALDVEDRDDGLWVNARFSNTVNGLEARELAADGTLDQCSVTFRPMREWMKAEQRADGIHVRHSRAYLLGVALVPHGAYDADAYVAAVRDADSDKAREARRARALSWTH